MGHYHFLWNQVCLKNALFWKITLSNSLETQAKNIFDICKQESPSWAFELSPELFVINNPKWNGALENSLNELKEELGLRNVNVSLQIEKMLICDKGKCIKLLNKDTIVGSFLVRFFTYIFFFEVNKFS